MNYIELCSQKNHNKNHMECTLGVALLTQPFLCQCNRLGLAAWCDTLTLTVTVIK